MRPQQILKCMGLAVVAIVGSACSEPALAVGVITVDGPPDCGGRCAWPAEACVSELCVPTGRENPLAVAHNANCFRTRADNIACWGANEWGQIGQGSDMPVSYATPRLLPRNDWISIAGGAGTNFLALDRTNRLWGWGLNSEGALGTGDTTNKFVPTLAKTSLKWAVLHAGSGHSCGQDQRGRLYCWGRNVNGELGIGSQARRTEPVGVANGRVWSLASVGWGHTCAITQDGSPWCWGRNTEGQLGLGHNDQRSLPEPVMTTIKFQQLSAHGLHTCAIEVGTQRLWCWGDNRDGKLGTGDQQLRNVPTLIAPTQRWIQVRTSRASTCGITTERQAWCWGGNYQAGSPDVEDPTDVMLPMQASPDNGWHEIGSGHSHVCGMKEGVDAPLCWGRGSEGQLGQGEFRDEPLPMPVLLP